MKPTPEALDVAGAHLAVAREAVADAGVIGVDGSSRLMEGLRNEIALARALMRQAVSLYLGVLRISACGDSAAPNYTPEGKPVGSIAESQVVIHV